MSGLLLWLDPTLREAQDSACHPLFPYTSTKLWIPKKICLQGLYLGGRSEEKEDKAEKDNSAV